MQTAGGSGKWLIVFSADQSLYAAEIGAAIQDYLALHFDPDCVCLLGFHFNWEQLEAVRHSDAFVDRLPPLLRTQQAVQHFSIQNDGIVLIEATDPPTVADITIVDRMRRSGLFSIFDAHEGLLKATETFHYVKPSGDHCDSFLRTAQVLVDGAEIDFIAGWLLAYLANDVTQIWCDTAAISSVAYAAARIKQLLAPEFRHPRISSFTSYVGLESAQIGSSCLIIISASTAGQLAQEIHKKANIDPGRIVTLYYLQGAQPTGVILCDLTFDAKHGSAGYANIVNYDPKSCPYCQDGSSAIRLKGEHFLPHETDIVKVLITANCAPAWLSPFLKMCHGLDVIRVHHRKGRRGEINELFIDVNRLLHSQTVFTGRFVGTLVKSLPATTKQIFHLSDQGSEAMALCAAQMLLDCTGRVVPIVTAQDVIATPMEYRVHAGATVVIASCVASGRDLLEVGQILRTIQPNKAVAFLIGLSRLPGQRELDQVKSNLTYTPDPRSRFVLHEVERIFLPDNTTTRPSIWSQEVKLLRNLRNRFSYDSSFPEDVIDQRIARIQAAEGTDVMGLRSDAFLPSVNGTPLQLRPNFAFLKFDYGAVPISQAEVFFVIASILNELRHSDRPNLLIRQQEFRRVIIDPQTFSRLNDGVVQAALLRASWAAELDYRLGAQISSGMTDLLVDIFNACEGPRGEATPEFLLALALRQLHLLDEDLLRAVDGAGKKVRHGSLEEYLCRYIKEDLR